MSTANTIKRFCSILEKRIGQEKKIREDALLFQKWLGEDFKGQEEGALAYIIVARQMSGSELSLSKILSLLKEELQYKINRKTVLNYRKRIYPKIMDTLRATLPIG